VKAAPRLALDQPRDVSGLFRDALAVYRAHLGTFIAAGAVVVVPVQLIVSGIGLEQLTSHYDKSPSPAETAIPTAVSFMVIAPLITAICIHALRAVAAGEGPAAGRAIRDGFEAFAPLFAALVLVAVGVAIGLLALILPGVYLAVRLFFVPQTVVIEGRRGLEALRRSGELVQGLWWRTFGIVLLAWLAAQIPVALIGIPFASLAAHADRQLWALVGETLTQAVASPFVALLSTLLYYDLRARQAARLPTA
jgi:hypothetical protein